MNGDAAMLIAEAMCAWSEVQMGYPDHWSKVTGSLSLAAESCDPNLPLFFQIAAESRKYMASVKSETAYRPPFEQMAADALNADAGKQVVPTVEKESTQLCYDCATKHLAEAKAAWMRWHDEENAWIDVLGNMGHASNHLVERHPDLANEIRDSRKRVWEAIVLRVMIQMPDFDGFIGEVLGVARAATTAGAEAERMIAKARSRR